MAGQLYLRPTKSDFLLSYTHRHIAVNMNLIAYSDSESDGEAPAAPKPALKQAPKSSFAKVVDRSNPGKIKVNLPGASQAHTPKDDIESEAPPAKKPRLGGSSAFGGFNSMLPAPKKPAAGASISAAPGKRGLGKGLAAGVSLKTGAEPAFKRESRVETEEYDENGNPVKKEAMKKEDFRAMLNLPPAKSDKKEETKSQTPIEVANKEPEPLPKAAPPRFVPMSVGKGKKKKPVVARPAVTSSEPAEKNPVAVSSSTPPPRKPKVSLFGVSHDIATPEIPPSMGEYQPMLYSAEAEESYQASEDPLNTHPNQSTSSQAVAFNNAPVSNDLTNMASELNLSEAERRQLLGKRGREADLKSARIVEFNTDTEYAHNEMLRQQGEQVQHNPLKSISGTGKNSLRSLVNVATTQKDALEDHFAAGYRNKKEAGNRYGW